MIAHLNQVRLSYPKKWTGRQPVLKGVDLELPPGRITALAAPNGEGKTSLLKVLAGLRFADSGRVTVLERDPARRPVDLLRRLYFLPAKPSLPDWTPARIGRIYGAFYPTFDEETFGRCLTDFSLDPDRSLAELSFGQQRRAQLAFALATRTKLLLLDEPTLGLDVAGKDQFRRSLIQATEEGQTVLIATHQLTEVEPVLDDLLILRDGVIAAHLSIATAYEQLAFDLVSSAPEPFVGSYVRRVPGGHLLVRPREGRSGNARPDLETLYLALTEGNLRLSAEPQNVTAHV